MVVGARSTVDLLQSWTAGDHDASDEVFDRLYQDLRRVAANRLAAEQHRDLGVTELVHEAYLRLVDQDRAQWADRRHFFAVAARVMRRILIDRARSRSAAKRKSDQLLTLSPASELLRVELPESWLELDNCLRDLEQLDPERAKLVELRYFVGLSLEETADLLGQSRATVVRRWQVTRGWLLRQLGTDFRVAQT